MKHFLKSVLKAVPFKKSIFLAVKSLTNVPERIYKHLYFKGIFKVKVDKSSSFFVHHYGYQIENEIFWAGLAGGWEKESMKLWIKLCKLSKNIFDVGANTGIYSLVAKAVKPEANVYAFEPVKRVKAKLDQNLKLNNFNVFAEELALSDYDGDAIIYDQEVEHTLSVAVNKNLAEDGIKTIQVRIKTITLKTYIEEQGIETIDLMKIDVETHEPQVLAGMGVYLKQFKPTLLIEILNDDIAKKIEILVEGCGYRFYNIDEKNPPKLVTSITKSDYYNFLICSQEIASKLNLPLN